jgi:hypothetical protein
MRKGNPALQSLVRKSLYLNVVGRLAQRLAHLLYTQVVGGSNPSSPTISPKLFNSFTQAVLVIDPGAVRPVRGHELAVAGFGETSID